MNVEITGRHVELNDATERHVRDHIEELPKYDDKIQYISVTLDIDGGNPAVEIVAKCHRADLVAEERGHDMYRCIDGAFAKIKRQIKRHHDRLVSHKPQQGRG